MYQNATEKAAAKKARRKARKQQLQRPADGRLLQFFDAVRQYRCLYDPADPLYEDKQCRDHVWQQLAVEFQMPDARARWNNVIAPTKSGKFFIKPEFARELSWLTPYLRDLSEYMNARGIPIHIQHSANGAPKEKKPIEFTKLGNIFYAVQKHSVLYNPAHNQFHNAAFKAEAWRRVVNESGFPDAQRQWSTVIVRQNVINGIQTFAIRKAYKTQIKWLKPFLPELGPAQDRENVMKMIDAVRPHPELYDDAHPRAKDEAHIKALWEQLKLDTQIEHITNRWDYLKKGLAAGKTEASGFAYAKELDWLRPYVQHMAQFPADKSVAAGWAPQPEGGIAVWGNGTDPPAPPLKMPWSKSSKVTVRKGKLIDRATGQQIDKATGQPIVEPPQKKQRAEEEEHLTCMLGSMLDMLREMPSEKRWDAYDKFREFFLEVNAEEKEHEEEEEIIELMDEDDGDQPTTSGT